MSEWINVKAELPSEGEFVETETEGERGSRWVTTRYRRQSFWFYPDCVMYTYFVPEIVVYTYYTPTHWRRKEAANDDKHRH